MLSLSLSLSLSLLGVGMPGALMTLIVPLSVLTHATMPAGSAAKAAEGVTPMSTAAVNTAMSVRRVLKRMPDIGPS